MKVYKYQNNLYYLDGEVEEIAIELGLEEITNCDPIPLSCICETELIKEGKCLNNEEIEQEIQKWNEVYENINEYDKNHLIQEMKKYLFIATGSYRGGEKTKSVAFRIHEDPIEKVKDWEDWHEMWEIYFENGLAEELYSLLREIYEMIV